MRGRGETEKEERGLGGRVRERGPSKLTDGQ